MTKFLVNMLERAKNGNMKINRDEVVKKGLKYFPFSSGLSQEQLEAFYWQYYFTILANQNGFRSIGSKVFANYENASNNELDKMLMNAKIDMQGNEKSIRVLSSEKAKRDRVNCEGQREIDFESLGFDFDELPMIEYASLDRLMSM